MYRNRAQVKKEVKKRLAYSMVQHKVEIGGIGQKLHRVLPIQATMLGLK